MTGWQLGHRPGLDGLRAVAILLVILSHSFGVLAAWGTSGVTVFFTLSGFLITTLLLEEHARSGRFSFRAFYVRRARRLLPALAAFLLLGGVVWALLGYGIAGLLRGAGIALAYVTNWVIAIDGSSDLTGPFSHTWSLSVEEQFYLIWPLLVAACFRAANPRRALLAVCAVGCIASFGLRLALWDGGQGHFRIYMGFDTRMDALLVGCALAAWMTARPKDEGKSSVRISLAVDLGAAAIAVAIVAVSTGPIDYLLLPTWLPWATAALIFGASHVRYDGVLSAGPMRWIGRRSYAMYLWYGIPLHLAFTHVTVGPRAFAVLVALAGIFVIAAVSWRYVEQPFLRRRSGDPRDSAEELVAGDVLGAGPVGR